MSNPQVENGYTRVANEIFEALARIRIPGEARQILDVVLRKTYGFNKKEDAISLSQFCLSTGMRKGDVCRAKNKAISMNMLKVVSKKANHIGNIYSINKDFSCWIPLAKKLRGVAKKQIIVSKKANNRMQKSDTQKTVTKDTVTKDISKKEKESFLQGDQWNEIIDSFRPINDLYRDFYSNRTERAALDHIAKTIGIEKLKNAIAFITRCLGDEFAPTITKPTELKRKYGQLQKYYKKTRNPKK